MLAYDLEGGVRAKFPDDASYKSHIRKLWMALKLQGDLVRRVVTGDLSIDDLANTPPEGLAGEELKRQQSKALELAQKSMIVGEQGVVMLKTKDNVRLIVPNAPHKDNGSNSNSESPAPMQSSGLSGAGVKVPQIPVREIMCIHTCIYMCV